MNSTKKNIAYQSIYQIATLLIPFLTTPYISRILGSEQVGIYSYTHSIVNYFMLISMLGIDYYGNRTIAKVRSDREKVNIAFSEIFYCHVLTSIIAIFVYLFFCFRMQGIYRSIGFIQTLYVLAEMLNINWLFAGLAEFKITVVRNVVIKVLTVISIFLFVNTSKDLMIYITIMAMGTFFSQSAVWIVFRKYASFVKVPLSDIIKHFKPMSILFVAIIATNIYRMIDKTMLGYLGQLSILGCYEYADKILRLPLSVIIAIGAVMLSKSSNMLVLEGEEKVVELLKTTLKYITLLASLLIFGIFEYGKDFSVLFFGEEYTMTGVLLNILAISFLFMTWNSILRTQYFMPKGHDKEYTISVWIGAMINIFLNLVLIPRYSAMGAAIATDLAYFSVTVSQLIFARKDIKGANILNTSLLSFLVGLVPFTVMHFVHKMCRLGWVSFFAQVMVFTVIFGGTSFFMMAMTSDPLLKSILRK